MGIVKKQLNLELPTYNSQILLKEKGNELLFISVFFDLDYGYLVCNDAMHTEKDIKKEDVEWWCYTKELL